MSKERTTSLIADAPVGRHFAQLHRDAAELVEAVAQFAEAGLRHGNGVLLIVTTEHADGIMARLESCGLDPESQRRSGQLAVYDARSVLNRILRDGMPSWSEFRRVVGSALESVEQLVGRNTTRAYGEIVGLLWRDGQQQAAIRLEEYWNELGRHYPFSLFCGYLLDGHHADCYRTPLHEIGRTHSDVLASGADERFHEAVDAACTDVLGIPLSQMLSLSGQEEHPGESRLPGGQRTLLWVMRHMPASAPVVLERARRHFQERSLPRRDAVPVAVAGPSGERR